VVESRFDQLCRMVARRASRRNLLFGLAAGLLTIQIRSPTAAQQVFLGPGEPCYDDIQCRGADAPLVCADNGFAYDGPLNCCTYEGSRCGFDEACCGNLECITGVCSSLDSSATYQGTPNGELNRTGYGFAPGQACIADSQCDNSFPELGIAYCAETGYVYGPYGGTQHCCRYEGGSCGGPLSDDHSLCCGGLLCVGGRCGWG
jgi:hypothetical protein